MTPTVPHLLPAAAEVGLDSATWVALALVLTVLGAGLSWVAWRRRGVAAGLRGLAWALVPLAAWLTGTLRLAVRVVEAVVDWATRLVFSPTVWLGIVLAAVAAGLWVVSGLMRRRGIGVRAQVAGAAPRRGLRSRGESEAPMARRPSRKSGSGSDVDDDMADIEAILKKHGI